MKTSELIAELQKAIDLHGDQEASVYDWERCEAETTDLAVGLLTEHFNSGPRVTICVSMYSMPSYGSLPLQSIAPNA